MLRRSRRLSWFRALVEVIRSSHFVVVEVVSPRQQKPCLPWRAEVTVLDYGAGNVRSIRNAIQSLGYTIRDVNQPEDVLSAKQLIFPGVGAFEAAMTVINRTGLAEAIRQYIAEDRPFLGICLGLQLLFEYSEEHGHVEGLGIIAGAVSKFDASGGLTVPHIGWNGVCQKKDSDLLAGINGRHVYFVHSYRALPVIAAATPQTEDNKDWVSATSNYGGDFISAVKKGNVEAVQWHPEKSGEVGLDALNRFLSRGQSAAEATEHVKDFKPASSLAKRVIACLDVRANDAGDLVVTKGDQYDVRQTSSTNEVRNLGKPVELAGRYFVEGADEVAFLNITGFREFPLGDMPMLEVLRRSAQKVFVPLTVGGGIRDFTDSTGRFYTSLEVAGEYFRSGADKISIGSDAVYAAEEYLASGVSKRLRQYLHRHLVALCVRADIDSVIDAYQVGKLFLSDMLITDWNFIVLKIRTGKSSIEQISYVYGAQYLSNIVDVSKTAEIWLTADVSLCQAVVVSIDPRKCWVKDPSKVPHKTIQCQERGPNGEEYAWYQCTVKGGREGRPIGAYELARAVEALGAGEILLNCIDKDGQGDGFDLELVEMVSNAVSIPVIASSGAGCPDHFCQVFHKTHAAAALAAGIFHRKEVSIGDVKERLAQAGVETRLL
eukprot:SM000106S14000  [mRNA]  locus=s106:420221:424884:- [translate_table: standard]